MAKTALENGWILRISGLASKLLEVTADSLDCFQAWHMFKPIGSHDSVLEDVGSPSDSLGISRS